MTFPSISSIAETILGRDYSGKVDDKTAESDSISGTSKSVIEAQQVHLLYSQAKTGVLGTVVNAGVLIFALWSTVSHYCLFIWSLITVTLTCARLFLVRGFFRSKQQEEQVRRWRMAMVVSSGASGALWGSTAIFLFPETSFIHQLFLTFMLGGLAVGAMGVMAAEKKVFFAFFLPILCPILFRLLLSETELAFTIGLLFLFFASFVLAAALHFNESTGQSLRLRLANLDLIRDLSQAKEEAEHVTSQLFISHAALSESEKRFRSLIEHSSDLITILGEDGVMRYHSPSILRLLGYDEHELIGQPVAMLFHATEEKKLKSVFAALLNEPSRLQSFELLVRHKNSSWRTFESIAQNLLDDSAVRGLVFNSRDITERKEMDRLKDELVSTVSHELRTPLTSLRGFAELMLTRQFSGDKQRHFLEIILSEGTRLTNLINDYLDIQRIESGRQTYHFDTLSLSSFLRKAVEIFQTEGSLHSFRLEVPDDVCPVQADAERLHQVLANLLSNAIKFSPRGGTVTLRVRQQGKQVIIEIADEGVGIPPDVLPKLFQKFYRVDNSETRSIGGTGLGLALVKDIIMAHGGHVWVESQPHVGSSFFFSLPVAAPSSTMQDAQTVEI